MAYSFPEIKSFQGLHLQRNSFTVPDGALEIAENVLIDRDNSITVRRGLYTYFDVSSGLLNKLFVFQETLLAIYNNKLAYYTDTGSLPNLVGSEHVLGGEAISLTNGRVSRSVESNNNLYFTTDSGVLKMTAFDSNPVISGAPQGLDINARFIPGQASFLEDDSDPTIDFIVAYRVLFGYRDVNDNLILSAPSSIYTVANIAVGYDGTDSTLSASVSGATMTVTSVAHGLISGMYLTFFAADGFTSSDNANGTYEITVTSLDAFTYVPTSPPTGGPGTIAYRMASPVRIEASVPSEVSSTALGWFGHLYRSSTQQFPIVYTDFRLVEERTITSTEITNNVMFYDDSTPEDLLGTDLYTNENTNEGELEANFRAPLCDDMTVFKGFTFYANCTTRHLLQLDVIDPTLIINSGGLEYKIGSDYRSYAPWPGVANDTVIALASSDAGSLLIEYTDHQFQTNDKIYISAVNGATVLNVGNYYVLSATTDTFQVASTVGGTPIAYTSETAIELQGVATLFLSGFTNKAWVRSNDIVTITDPGVTVHPGKVIYITSASGGTLASGEYSILTVPVPGMTYTIASVGADDPSGNTCTGRYVTRIFKCSEELDASIRIRDTAQGIVKCINRDPIGLVYAQYSSLPSQTPGKMRFQAIGFGDPIYFRAVSDGGGYYPNLPTSFSAGTQVFSTNQTQENAAYISKGDEPEAVPLLSYIFASTRNKGILRVVALRDSVVFVTLGGIFRCTGDNRSNFTVAPVDRTIICVAPSSVEVLNNNVIFLSNQGVALVTESSVQIISRNIEDLIQPILGQTDLASITGAVSYETQRLYFLCTSTPSTTVATVTYVYNYLTDAWTTSDKLFTQGVIGPNDTLYLANDSNNIAVGRTTQTKIDYSDEFYPVTIDSVAADGLSAVITSNLVSPLIGDMIVKDNVISRFDTMPVSLSTNQYSVTFARPTNLVALDSVILYAKFISQVKMSPFHAGLVGRMKHFAQMQVQFKDNNCSKLEITFSGSTYGSSKMTNWVSELLAMGWGEFPWGMEPWGQGSSIILTQGTTPAPICRIWVPRYQARNTFIQPLLVHQEAGEPMAIQALSFDVRAYGERTSR